MGAFTPPHASAGHPAPRRGFHAVAIAEPQWAFHGARFANDFPPFVYYGLPPWVPEAVGAIVPDNDAHDLLVGGMPRAEGNRPRSGYMPRCRPRHRRAPCPLRRTPSAMTGRQGSDERVTIAWLSPTRGTPARAGTIELAIPKARQGSCFPHWLLERRRRAEQEQALASAVALPACWACVRTG